MDDGRIYIGFLDTFIGQNAIQTVEVSQYDLNEETSELRSNESIVTFIPTNKIIKLEAIQYSNPRWGTKPTNKFEFAKPVKIDPELEPFKNWLRK